MAVPGAQRRIVAEVSGWEGVEASPHRFGGTEFTLGRRKFGHVHGDYQADIPFPMAVRKQIVAEGRAEPHHVFPQSGWITFRFRREEDVDAAVRLFRMAYERALANPRAASAAVSEN